jgi:hypothetical protein
MRQSTIEAIAHALDTLADRLSQPLTPAELAQIVVAIRTTAASLRKV